MSDDANESDVISSNRARRKLGLRITAAILVVATTLSLWGAGGTSIWGLPLNEIGDFLAGVAAPIAFLWLVLGYMQQADQLELQRRELALQRQELKLQRQETARLADEAGRQAKAVEISSEQTRRDTFMRYYELILRQQISICLFLLETSVGLSDRTDRASVLLSRGDTEAPFRVLFYELRGRNPQVLRDIAFNPRARSRSIRFVRNFEALADRAKETMPEVLNSIEFGAMGDLYAALCLEIGRDQRFLARSRVGSLEAVDDVSASDGETAS
jgi:hypothetical protein